MLAGLAGGLFAMAQEGAYVQVMTLQWSGIVVLMTLTGGGLVSFWGPVLGTIVFFVARDVLGSLTETWMIWYGLMFMAIVMFKPDGIAGMLQDVQARMRRGRAAGVASLRRTSRGPAMALFETHHLHKRFGRQVVLEEVNLAFEEGRLSGIMGPNGAGKTTCFNVLTGRFKPDRGRVIFDGADITGLPPRAIAARGIARSFQAMNLFDDFSALLNVALALPGVRARHYDLLGGLMREEHAAEAPRGPGACGLAATRAHVTAKSLPYGDRRRLDIALALAQRPKILFLDEPTSGLSADAVAQLAELLGELKRSVTIVLIEHNMAFLFALADYVSVMHWGQIIAEGTPAELREDDGCRPPTWAASHEAGRRHASTPSTARPRRCSASRWRSASARSWRCLAPTVPARPRSCARSWA